MAVLGLEVWGLSAADREMGLWVVGIDLELVGWEVQTFRPARERGTSGNLTFLYMCLLPNKQVLSSAKCPIADCFDRKSEGFLYSLWSDFAYDERFEGSIIEASSFVT